MGTPTPESGRAAPRPPSLMPALIGENDEGIDTGELEDAGKGNRCSRNLTQRPIRGPVGVVWGKVN